MGQVNLTVADNAPVQMTVLRAPSLGSLTGMSAQDEAFAKLEALEQAADMLLARQKSNMELRAAIKDLRAGDIAEAAKLALAATTSDPENAQAFHILGIALEKMGHQHKALVTYEKAFALDPEDPELLINLGLTAWNLKLTDGAARMFQLYIQAKPDSPLGYNNLGSVLCDMGDPETAIDLLRDAIFKMPAEPLLWNSLATVLAETGRAEESLIFYEEAVRLDPCFSRPHHNLGFAFQHLGRLEEALDCYDQALMLATDEGEQRESRHSRSICLIGMGRLEAGFQEYEVRNDPKFRAYLHHMVKAPQWQGEDLAGKRILVLGEQGLGDEFMFANVLPDLQRAVGQSGHLQIAVDPRLVSLFQRSFPKAQVGNYDDRKYADPDGNKELRFVPWACDEAAPDYFTPVGSALRYFRHKVSDFPKVSFLTAEAKRIAAMQQTLAALGAGPKIGICWRSMMMDIKRGKYYSALENWQPILQLPGVHFVNLQYGDCAQELAEAEARFGIKIHVVDGLDLKNDIEGLAALTTTLDLVISAPTASAALAGAVGTDVWFVAAGRTWPQLGTEEFPWYRKSRVFSPEKFADWPQLCQQIAQSLAARL